ncbi:hypothetical protein ACFFWD_07980 [Bradyrhizobium erythrophlei]|uniref:hypothetical protein n=1 Tax=Bradyrhizobium erythrophlei TaxID=1437360 RepID=UPI0035EF732B
MELVERHSFGWQITEKGRAVLEYVESHARVAERLPAADADAPELASPIREVPPMTPNVRRRAQGKSRRRPHPRARIA